MFMLEYEGQTANTRNQWKVNKETKIPCAVWENTKLFYFCLIGWKGSTTFLGQQSEVKQNKWI